MGKEQTPYWLLIAVMFSSMPLTSALAMYLHQVAYDLYQRDEVIGQIAGDLAFGRVLNLQKNLLLGTITGPAFEAELETERGRGTVRFLLTRQGLDMMEAKKKTDKMMLN